MRPYIPGVDRPGDILNSPQGLNLPISWGALFLQVLVLYIYRTGIFYSLCLQMAWNLMVLGHKQA